MAGQMVCCLSWLGLVSELFEEVLIISPLLLSELLQKGICLCSNKYMSLICGRDNKN